MRELHLFSGVGGGILGGTLLGHTCVCAVEIEPFCRKVLLQRQRDGILPKFPIWDDVKTFDGKPWRGLVDIICGGFPCQDISVAGKGRGITGEQSGLWMEMERIIREVEPAHVFVENSPALLVRGFGSVVGGLAEMGYDSKWGVLGTKDCGGHCRRDRIWVFASPSKGGRRKILRSELGWGNEKGCIGKAVNANPCSRIDRIRALEKVAGEPAILGGDSNVPDTVDRLHSIGNAQCPVVAATAFRILSQG